MKKTDQQSATLGGWFQSPLWSHPDSPSQHAGSMKINKNLSQFVGLKKHGRYTVHYCKKWCMNEYIYIYINLILILILIWVYIYIMQCILYHTSSEINYIIFNVIIHVETKTSFILDIYWNRNTNLQISTVYVFDMPLSSYFRIPHQLGNSVGIHPISPNGQARL